MPGCLLLVAAFVSSGNLRAADAPPKSVTAQASAPVAGKFASEKVWIVDSIGRDVSEMLLYAKHANAPASPDGGAAAAPTTATGNVTLSSHPWDPKNYVLLAKAMSEQWKLQAPEQKSATDANLLKRLTSDSLTEMVTESRRVSKDLSLHPLDAELHEQAALILGSFGLRETAGTFADTRPTLCRMSAHLAMARVLREKQEVCGQIADAILTCLVNRQKETLEKIALFPKEQSAWAAALKMRATGDWRVATAPEKASFLEQSEYARALAKSVDVTSLRNFLGKMDAQLQPEWSRIAMEQHFGVEDGHVFVKGSIVLELDDLKKDWEQWSGKKLDDTKLAETVNDPATRAVVKGADGKPHIEVLSWGDLAAFHQRHICQSIDQTLHFLRDLWGVPDVAKQFETTMEGKLSGIRLYPFVRLKWAQDPKQSTVAMADAAKLCTEQPELVTAASWGRIRENDHSGGQPPKVPDPLRWFAPPLVAGTVYDIGNRYHVFPVITSLGPLYLEQLRDSAPYELEVLTEIGRRKFGQSPTVQQMQESMANISDYNIVAMWRIANRCKDDPKEYLTRMRKACDLRPDLYLSLAQYLVEKQMPKEAAYAYQAAFERATDRVGMANASEWIVTTTLITDGERTR